MLAHIFSLCQNSKIEITCTYTYQMTFCSFSIKFLLPLNTSLQHPVLFVNCPALPVTAAVHEFSFSGQRKQIVFADLPFSVIIIWATTEPLFIAATASVSKAFCGSIRHVNFSPTKGIQILLHLRYPMIWDTISYSWINILGKPSSCMQRRIHFRFFFREIFWNIVHSTAKLALSFCSFFCI